MICRQRKSKKEAGQPSQEQPASLIKTETTTIPTSSRTLLMLADRSVRLNPSTIISPPVGFFRTLRHLRKVLLPEPLGPITTTTSLGFVRQSTPRKTSSLPKFLWRVTNVYHSCPASFPRMLLTETVPMSSRDTGQLQGIKASQTLAVSPITMVPVNASSCSEITETRGIGAIFILAGMLAAELGDS